MSEQAIHPRGSFPYRRSARAMLAGALAALCLTSSAPALADDGSGDVRRLLRVVRKARLITDLSHAWGNHLSGRVGESALFVRAQRHAREHTRHVRGRRPAVLHRRGHALEQHGAPSIDAIGHIGRDGKLFGGLDAAAATSNPDGIGASGVGANLAIDRFPTDLLVNRGILLDVARMVQGDLSPLPADFRGHRGASGAGGEAPARAAEEGRYGVHSHRLGRLLQVQPQPLLGCVLARAFAQRCGIPDQAGRARRRRRHADLRDAAAHRDLADFPGVPRAHAPHRRFPGSTSSRT